MRKRGERVIGEWDRAREWEREMREGNERGNERGGMKEWRRIRQVMRENKIGNAKGRERGGKEKKRERKGERDVECIVITFSFRIKTSYKMPLLKKYANLILNQTNFSHSGYQMCRIFQATKNITSKKTKQRKTLNKN